MRLFICMLVLCAAVAPGAEIVLNDGRVVTGTILDSSDGEQVDVELRLGNMVLVQHIERHRIASIDYAMSAQERERAAILARMEELGAAGEASQWWGLVERARAIDDRVLARHLAEEVTLRDRHHIAAHRMLGLRKLNGIWMRPFEAQVASGRIFREGRWWKPDAWEQELEVRAERLAARRARREERARQRAAAAQVPTLPERALYLRYRGDSYIQRYRPLLGYYGYSQSYPLGTSYRYHSSHSHSGSGIRVQLGGGSDSFNWRLNWSW